MPDVWSNNPEKLRKLLTEIGGSCGRESRVLHPRDPEWTCHVDPGFKGGEYIGYDVYIHWIGEYWQSRYGASQLIFAAGAGVLIGLLWGRRFWRRAVEGPFTAATDRD